MMNEGREIREVIDFDRIMEGCRSAIISGHVRPDGDCVGSCLGLAHFLRQRYPQVHVDVCLEDIREEFRFLEGADTVITDSSGMTCDVFFCLDCCGDNRLGIHGHLMKSAGKTVCIDHHLTSSHLADICYIDPEASSASELTALAIGLDRIDEKSAEALYLGMVHDTGVFQYPCTSSRTMRIAGELMDKGIPYSRICEDTFFSSTYLQKKIMGKVLLESRLFLDDQVIIGVLKKEDINAFGAQDSDLAGIVAQLRSTRGVHAAVFAHEAKENEFRVSLRADEQVDVSKIASCYGGGGHARASGCTIRGTAEDVQNKLLRHFEQQLNAK